MKKDKITIVIVINDGEPEVFEGEEFILSVCLENEFLFRVFSGDELEISTMTRLGKLLCDKRNN